MIHFEQVLIKGQKPACEVPYVGDKVNVHVKVFEGNKERIQIFQGVVLKIKGSRLSKAFTVRKISDGIGVERTFPIYSPVLSKLEVLSHSKVRRSKLYFIRNLKGRASRLTSVTLDNKAQSKVTSAKSKE